MQDAELKIYRGIYYAYWREGGKARRSSLGIKATKENRLEAERELVRFKEANEAPIVTCEDIMAKYIEKMDGKGNMDRVRECEKTWRRLGPSFGHLEPNDINEKMSQMYHRTRRGAGVMNSSINKELQTLNTALTSNDKHHRAVIEYLPNDTKKKKPFTREDFAKLLAAAKSYHVKTFMMLAIGTAGRQKAILDLTWDRVDFQNGLIQLSIDGEAKSKKGRATVPMSKALRAWLLDAKRAATTDYVVEYHGGRLLRINEGVKAAAKRVGLDWVTPHIFRHSAATWMAMDDVRMAKIAEFLGHENTDITRKIYAHYQPSFLADAVGSLEV